MYLALKMFKKFDQTTYIMVCDWAAYFGAAGAAPPRIPFNGAVSPDSAVVPAVIKPSSWGMAAARAKIP